MYDKHVSEPDLIYVPSPFHNDGSTGNKSVVQLANKA
jgi:hypothetical protein